MIRDESKPVMDLQIDMEAADTPDVAALIEELDRYQAQLYPPESNHLLDLAALVKPNVLFCVARADGVAVGCGAAVLLDGYAELKRMYVAPAYRGKGLGGRILAFLESALEERDVNLARLETGTQQEAAMRLYETAGYRAIPPFDNYVEDPHSLFFEKSLLPAGR